jgi:DNA repair protein RecN (Recombination protein N)
MAALRRLVLRDFVIVDQLDVELQSGFTVLTGETGAGKSILIDALQLALGNRADAGVVREGCARADITAEFEVTPDQHAGLSTWLEDSGLDAPDDDATLMLRRVVDAQGKSRAWVNGRPATLTQLRELADWLVDIHGQHAWQSLTRPEAVRALVDEYAGVNSDGLATTWQRRKQAQQALDEARARQTTLEQERERLQWQIAELAKLNPGRDEWAELNEEHGRLSHGQAILDAARTALEAVSESDENADSLLGRAEDALQDVAAVLPALNDALGVLREARAQVQDAARSLNSVLNHTELDPDRLAELDARLSAWLGQARRLRRQPAELPEVLTQWQHELAELDAATDLETLERTVREADQAWRREAEAVSRQRHDAAPALGQAVTEAMQTLGMAGGRFEVALVPQDAPQAWGLESIELRVAGHAGSTPRALAKVASGGELSRLALAIAVTTSSHQRADASGITLIFDEIDSGVGGQVADTVGRLMQRLGRQHQVLAVTHLAQVAACAHQHLVVSKAARDGQTLSDIRSVQADERVHELARMLGGQVSETSLAHAQSMMSAAHETAQHDAAGRADSLHERTGRRRREAA